jgi:hypothetical protein
VGENTVDKLNANGCVMLYLSKGKEKVVQKGSLDLPPLK